MESLKKYLNNLSPLQDQSWDAIEPLFESKTLSSQQLFEKERVYARKIAFLKKGCIRSYVTNEDGKEFNMQLFIGPNIICAYTSLLTMHRNNVPLQALTECEILVADYKALEKEYANYPDLERLGRKIAENKFLAIDNREVEMTLQDATSRYLTFSQEYPGLEDKVPHYHIASYLGITATQLSRLRKGLNIRK